MRKEIKKDYHWDDFKNIDELRKAIENLTERIKEINRNNTQGKIYTEKASGVSQD